MVAEKYIGQDNTRLVEAQVDPIRYTSRKHRFMKHLLLSVIEYVVYLTENTECLFTMAFACKASHGHVATL